MNFNVNYGLWGNDASMQAHQGNKFNTLVGVLIKGGRRLCADGGRVCMGKLCTFYSFCFEPKTALKNKV